ncbi:uncharacterized protein LOC104456664 isoform X2 [Eucalyptus grandis]|uniref:uncharacterized protein LOC104456664 isoform X2 n=1 Tax=Eucalyptus grandis TaxID=71139 RepID=UPI00192ECD05|nr:uncharacterized protein LOC104456664 isoform X2 [Eucalyptus grandis]
MFVDLSQRLGPDVREGKRRQFNFIGKLLREVEPELVDAITEATKNSDHSRLQALSVSKVWFGKDDDEGEEDLSKNKRRRYLVLTLSLKKICIAYRCLECSENASIASSWFDGLISKDIQIANEVFSNHTIDFDQQELRKLVRSVQSTQEQPAENEREASIALLRAQKSPARFL